MSMRSIAFINQKGGVGKTTSTLNVGAGLARSGKKVLLVDFDPQASLTYSLAFSANELSATMYELLKKTAFAHSTAEISVREFLIPLSVASKGKLCLLPSSINLGGLENDLRHYEQRDFVFKRLMPLFSNFDYVLIDCPPNLGLLTLNALAAVQEIFVPVETEFLALQGLSDLAHALEVIKQSHNPTLKLGGIIGTKFNRRKLHKDTVECLKQLFPEIFFNTLIRDTIALAEAPSFGKDVYSHSPDSPGAEDYSALCKEILAAEQHKGAPL